MMEKITTLKEYAARNPVFLRRFKRVKVTVSMRMSGMPGPLEYASSTLCVAPIEEFLGNFAEYLANGNVPEDFARMIWEEFPAWFDGDNLYTVYYRVEIPEGFKYEKK